MTLQVGPLAHADPAFLVLPYSGHLATSLTNAYPAPSLFAPVIHLSAPFHYMLCEVDQLGLFCSSVYPSPNTRLAPGRQLLPEG